MCSAPRQSLQDIAAPTPRVCAAAGSLGIFCDVYPQQVTQSCTIFQWFPFPDLTKLFHTIRLSPPSSQPNTDLKHTRPPNLTLPSTLALIPFPLVKTTNISKWSLNRLHRHLLNTFLPLSLPFITSRLFNPGLNRALSLVAAVQRDCRCGPALGL